MVGDGLFEGWDDICKDKVILRLRGIVLMMRDKDNVIVCCVKEMQNLMLGTKVCSCGRKQWLGIVRWDDCRAATVFHSMSIMLVVKKVRRGSKYRSVRRRRNENKVYSLSWAFQVVRASESPSI